MSILEYDNKATQRLLPVYVTPDVVAQRNEFVSAVGFRAGERVLDVGAGPGFLASAIAEIVGPSGSVCGVDTITTGTACGSRPVSSIRLTAKGEDQDAEHKCIFP